MPPKDPPEDSKNKQRTDGQLNVLWIMTDQHRADCLGYAGHPIVQTPHLDQVASRGVIFENAFCQSPVCMASRASLITGRYPGSVRVRGMGILPPTETTFPEVLRQHGYQTAAFGKVHLTPEKYTLEQRHENAPNLDWRAFASEGLIQAPVPHPFKEHYGFEHYLGYEDILPGRFLEWLRERNPNLPTVAPKRFGANTPSDLFVSPYSSANHPSSFIAEETSSFIRDRKEGSPWFSFCSFVAPHHPFEAPEDQIFRYDLPDIPLPAYKGGVDFSYIPERVRTALEKEANYSEETWQRIAQHYFASISLIDDGIAQVLQALEESGQMDNTLIVFNSDHGEFLGNHGLLRKPSLHYDETLRVPLFITAPPGRLAPRREQGLVELTDLFPTLLGLLGIPVTPGVQGRDWSSALLAKGTIGREDIFSDMYDITPQRFGEFFGPYTATLSFRTEEWKLNLYPTAGRSYGQLFDLKNDPDESQNRYGDAQYRGVREEMIWRLLQRQHLNTDPMPPYLTQF